MTTGRLISLYTGGGGLDLGFALEGFQPVFANDVDSLAPSTYKAVFEQLRANGGAAAVHKYTVGDISADFRTELKADEEAVLVGGPPCQGFSRAGRMDPGDPRSQHVRNFLEAANVVRPRAFVMENVSALAESVRWRPILNELEDRAHRIGYSTTVLRLNARDHGVPQSRERMFMIGLRAGERALELEREPIGPQPVTVRDALQDLSAEGVDLAWQRCTAKIVPALRPVLRTSPFAGMMFNGQGRPLALDAPAPTISASLGGNHTPIIDSAWLADKSEGGESIRRYHRELIAGMAPTVPETWRRISLAEAAQLQSFPRDMALEGPLSGRFRHIGNAVPPLLAAHVARLVADSLGLSLDRRSPVDAGIRIGTTSGSGAAAA